MATQDLDASAPVVPNTDPPAPGLDLGSLFRDAPAGRARLVRTVAALCRDPGYFSISNLGVDPALFEGVLTQAARFFTRPDDDPIKTRVHNRLSPGGVGWGPLFQEPAYQPGTVAHLESFDVSPPQAWIGDEALAAGLGIYPNQWPALDGFEEAVAALYLALRRTSDALFEVFAEVLGAPRDFFRTRATHRAPSTMRLLHYPGQARPASASNVGIAAHTDFECFTMMFQTAAGLEVTDTAGVWRRAPARPGEVLVILGDMLERLSNGAFKATGHRVTITPWPRYAVILFNALDGDCEVAPLAQFVSPGHPAAYAPVTQSAHIAAEVARAHAHLAPHAPGDPP